MRIPTNKISDIAQYFRNELSSNYEKEEIEKFIQYCFEDFVGFTKTDLLIKQDKTVSESDLLKFHFAVKDLKRGRPIQYILGKAHFYGMEFIVNSNVLIPRPETEELVKLILDDAKLHAESFSILDIGTGSGCIAIALKKNLPRCHVYALDISEEALKVAKENALRNECEIHFIKGDICDTNVIQKLPACTIIVSNPPYIKSSERAAMHENVVEHEPHLALFVPDDDALLFYKVIAEAGKSKLKSGGAIYVEINEALGIDAAILFQKAGYSDVQLLQDMQGKDRMIKMILDKV
ncbi:MAG: peptide chain release factor N(5)-glutamine methyltransferase [Bacteroidota bacterium]|nr:peptide chain release factor N(5)-glutamine methyltransferase [Bacteroidota bacterium]